ncbi:MAG TPA: Uma2 family endonuclease [Chthonomonadaceae bacterium]|nr:Uma2 family endonuclease [Chthonomonadaceae bacterium]
MTTATLPPGQPMPPRKLWSRKEYEHLIDLGVFTPDDRLELLEGEIVYKMPQNTPHSTGIRLSEKLLNRIFAEGYDVRAQLPLAVSDDSEPEPDIAVVLGDVRDYEVEHPTTAVLVIEVADSTLMTDRKIKARLYARAGVLEYWIVNLNDRVLEVHRNPTVNVENSGEPGYVVIQTYAETESLAPLAMTNAVILVSDLLPRRNTEEQALLPERRNQDSA